MKKELNVLFLGGAKRVSLAQHLMDAGKKRGFEVHVYSYELDKCVPVACVGEVIIGKKWKDSDLYSDLHHVIEKYRITMVLPFVDPAILVANHLKVQESNVFVPVSSEEMCKTMFDKVLSAEWFEKYGVKHPDTYTKDTISYPAIFKPRKGSASKGIFVAYSVENHKDVNLDDYLVQQYIEGGKEYTVDCYVAQDGRVLSVVPRVRLETAGGEVVRSMTVRNEAIIKESRSILATKNLIGPVTLQFISNREETEFYIMEINPRLGGGVVTSIGAGSGILNMLLDEYEGKRAEASDEWKENTIMTRYFKEVIFYADNY